MDNISKKFLPVKQSITNADVQTQYALDRINAFSFLEFIKVIKVNYSPDTLQEYYTWYLQQWNNITLNTPANKKQLIVDKYKEFLRDITINYTTNAERKFLSLMDYNNPADLSVAVSFFSKKLRDIASYYKDKRDILHYSTTKNKLKGSIFGAQKNITSYVLNYLSNRDTSELDYDIDVIKQNISLTLTEYIDVYTNYYNLEPDVFEYGRTDLSFHGMPADDLFLKDNDTLIREVFSSFTLDELQLREIDELISNKRELTSKLIGTDFYYISSNSTGDFIFEKLIESRTPASNFLNQKYPTLVTKESGDIVSKKNVGYFDQTKTGIVVIQANSLDFFLKTKYEPDSLYIFPDPAIFTNNQDILTFNISPSQIIKNKSCGIAQLQPNTSKDDTSFIGYVSNFAKRSTSSDLSYIFDKGYIYNATYDVFGNIYGLLKDDNMFRQNVELIESKRIKNLIFNGYQFFDTLYGEGYNFNYSTIDNTTYPETIRSGLSTFTGGFADYSLSAYNIFFRYFYPYEELIDPTSPVDYYDTVVETADVYDAGYFAFSNTESLPDPISSDLDVFEDTAEQFYFTDLLEGGVSYFDGGIVATRALNDALFPTVTGDFTYNVRLSGDNGIDDYDAGKFTDKLLFEYIPSFESYTYNDTVLYNTTLSINASATGQLYSKMPQTGTIYIRNSVNGMVDPILTTLPYLSARYPESVVNELSSFTQDFNMVYNTLFIQTSSYLVIEQINYDNAFKTPTTYGVTIPYNDTPYSKVSTRYNIGTKTYYCKLAQITTDNVKEFAIYPEIYEYDYTTAINRCIFPTAANSIASLSAHFIVPNNNVLYTEADTPVLTYSSDNELFELAYLLKDQNKSPMLVSIQFDFRNTIDFKQINTYLGVSTNNTFIFSTTDILTSFSFSLSTGNITTTDNYLIL